jgi:hypothetical protein
MDYYSTAQAAAILGITIRAVQLAIQQQRLDALDVGGRWIITPEAIEHFRRTSLRRVGRPLGRKNNPRPS